MESTQSVHGRITYRRAAAVIDEKIETLNSWKEYHGLDSPSIEKLQFAIQTLQSLREQLEWRDATHYWPSLL